MQQWIRIANDAFASTAHAGEGASAYRHVFRTVVDGTFTNDSPSTTPVFVLEGDGQTDALPVGGIAASATPEPASLALVGTRLVGWGVIGARRRRRRAQGGSSIAPEASL